MTSSYPLMMSSAGRKARAINFLYSLGIRRPPGIFVRTPFFGYVARLFGRSGRGSLGERLISQISELIHRIPL